MYCVDVRVILFLRIAKIEKLLGCEWVISNAFSTDISSISIDNIIILHSACVYKFYLLVLIIFLTRERCLKRIQLTFSVVSAMLNCGERFRCSGPVPLCQSWRYKPREKSRPI